MGSMKILPIFLFMRMGMACSLLRLPGQGIGYVILHDISCTVYCLAYLCRHAGSIE